MISSWASLVNQNTSVFVPTFVKVGLLPPICIWPSRHAAMCFGGKQFEERSSLVHEAWKVGKSLSQWKHISHSHSHCSLHALGDHFPSPAGEVSPPRCLWKLSGTQYIHSKESLWAEVGKNQPWEGNGQNWTNYHISPSLGAEWGERGQDSWYAWVKSSTQNSRRNHEAKLINSLKMSRPPVVSLCPHL